ncbi:uncharacterized protein LOC131025567 [Salvia miltiorrhiza]|uniref:uncharacterized protein LOC131025567 n=1 Tax=Salvia miltiorrhiza TaxID=226208 RepID=UPI0025ABE3B1|nr:uncharacterized protein LOC131025567 [Salvia miltiorrhiza]
MLANDGAADQHNEYQGIAESTSLECLRRFCRVVIQLFGTTYLRRPTPANCQRLIAMHEEKHGFPGILGSFDCMHWAWKNCPTAWQGAYTRGDQGEPTIILEAVALQDLWIWKGSTGHVSSHYYKRYYLIDDIYPNWPVFGKSPTHPTNEKSKRFNVMQEAARKDIERAFGVLQAQWAIIKGPARLWSKAELSDIMFTCIILHNMIVQDEGEQATKWAEEGNDEASSSSVAARPRTGASVEFRAYVARQASMRDAKMHVSLGI